MSDECDKGKRTKENMKTLCGLVYKYACAASDVAKELILSQYLIINEKAAENTRTGLTQEELGKLQASIGKVPYADYIFCMRYRISTQRVSGSPRGALQPRREVFHGRVKDGSGQGQNQSRSLPRFRSA